MGDQDLNLIGKGGVLDPFLTPATLAMSLWPGGAGREKWLPAKFLLYFSSRIAHAILKGSGRLVVSVPPRHGKSRLISETTIPWFLEKFPGKHVMLASYNQEQASEFGRSARDLMIDNSDLFSVSVRRDVKRVDHFMMNNGSKVRFIGVGGGATGKGAHLMVVDDYIKGIDEALSPTDREKKWLGFLANIDSRLEPGGTVIVVATRWHSDDLIGRITSRLNGWEVINFPAIATENDILGRSVGEPLFPARYDLDRLLEIKEARQGTFLWESLYQQVPIDDISGFTDPSWLQVEEWPIGVKLQKVRSWDMAATQGGGDFTVGALLAKHLDDTGRCGILHIARAQLGPKGVEDLIRKTAVNDGPEVIIQLEREPGSQGKALVEHYKRNVLRGFKVVESPVGNKSKIVRAQPMVAAVESGRLYAVANGSWVDGFRNEFGSFPSEGTGVHDDMVDAVSHSYNYLYQNDTLSAAWFAVDDYAGSYYDDLGNGGIGHNSGNVVSGCVW